MSKYSVKMIAICDVFVEDAKDDEEAMSLAQDYVSSSNYQFHEASVEDVTDEQADSYRRHADVVVPK